MTQQQQKNYQLIVTTTWPNVIVIMATERHEYKKFRAADFHFQRQNYPRTLCHWFPGGIRKEKAIIEDYY